MPALWLIGTLVATVLFAIRVYRGPTLDSLVWTFVWSVIGGLMCGVIAAFMLYGVLEALAGLPLVHQALTGAARRVASRPESAAPLAEPFMTLLPTLPQAASEHDRVVLRGRVRAKDPLVSPLGGVPAIAFRLVGKTELGEVDDAALAPFEVFEGGQWVPVSGEAIVDLEPGPSERVRRPSEELARFLRERSVWGRGVVRLAEGVLRPGDVVEVSGPPEQQQRSPSGYRDTSSRLEAVTGTSARPLVIRRCVGDAPEPPTA